MSLHTLPILFFNLGGEMIYILDQRLHAQNVPPKKAVKVVRDIVSQMFDDRCLKELFKPQKVFRQKSLRAVFDKLAHASIMKLNSSAMDKLYDLMLMAVKYQVLMCGRADDIILVTLNHLDTIRSLVGDSPSHIAILNSTARTITDYYKELRPAQYILLRSTILASFQDTHKRVSIFLKNKVQQTNGRFLLPLGGSVPTGFEVPGTIRYFDDKGSVVKEEEFLPEIFFDPAERGGSWDVEGDRVITLGTNMYTTSVTNTLVLDKDSSQSPELVESTGKPTKHQGDSRVKAELKLLETLLMGIREPPSSEDCFKLRLFPDDSEEEIPSKQQKAQADVVQITPSKKGKDELNKIMKDLTLDLPDTSQDTSDDLLDLMDSVS